VSLVSDMTTLKSRVYILVALQSNSGLGLGQGLGRRRRC